jgi:hypothetical protein
METFNHAHSQQDEGRRHVRRAGRPNHPRPGLYVHGRMCPLFPLSLVIYWSTTSTYLM